MKDGYFDYKRDMKPYEEDINYPNNERYSQLRRRWAKHLEEIRQKKSAAPLAPEPSEKDLKPNLK